jgi:hypothetical protein
MNYLCGQTRTITQEIVDSIKRKKDDVWTETSKDGNVYYISLGMIEIVS